MNCLAPDIDPELVAKIDDTKSECSVKVTSQDGQAVKKKPSHSVESLGYSPRQVVAEKKRKSNQ